MVGTGVAARHGILIRDAQALERAHAVDTVMFDKTGTLTLGQPQLLACEPAPGWTGAQLACLAGAVGQHSAHPLARAVLAWTTEQGLVLPAAQAARVLPGRGVAAEIDGATVYLGSARMLDELGADVSADLSAEPRANPRPDADTGPGPALALLQAAARRHEEAGRTVSWLARSTGAPPGPPQLLGMLAFGDQIKPGAGAVIAALAQSGVSSMMLTGDNAGAARSVAEALGITRFTAAVLPDGKADAVRAAIGQGRIVAMVGDGINDAPALAAADVGMAMAGGTDIAMHTAGITLMRGDLRLVHDALDISRRTWRTIRQNLVWAFAYNLVGIVLAACGQLNPMLAGAAMALSSVSVVTNALLLRRWRPTAAAPAALPAPPPGPSPTSTPTPTTGENSMLVFQVQGMSCGHCAGRVTESVRALDPHAQVVVDLASATVRVDSSASAARIMEVLGAAGYPAQAQAQAAS
jgi:Cu+-exporting ATPase